MNKNEQLKIGLAIPTYNANTNNDFEQVLQKIVSQKNMFDVIKIYDSESTDDTVLLAKKYKIEFETIKKEDFSHSGTRTKISQEMYDKGIDLLFFITQDVYLDESAISNAIDFMNSHSCAMVYGKQEVDLKKGNVFEYFSREFNYGSESLVKTRRDINTLGIKTIFCSDAFAVYNLKITKEVGYFGDSVNFSEDMLIADKLIQSGYTIGYCASAKVTHTHNYSIREEFERYRVIGSFHKEQKDIIKRYGNTESEGLRLVIGEIGFLISIKKIHKIPESLTRNLIKLLGMKIGYYFNE